MRANRKGYTMSTKVKTILTESASQTGSCTTRKMEAKSPSLKPIRIELQAAKKVPRTSRSHCSAQGPWVRQTYTENAFFETQLENPHATHQRTMETKLRAMRHGLVGSAFCC